MPERGGKLPEGVFLLLWKGEESARFVGHSALVHGSLWEEKWHES